MAHFRKNIHNSQLGGIFLKTAQGGIKWQLYKIWE